MELVKAVRPRNVAKIEEFLPAVSHQPQEQRVQSGDHLSVAEELALRRRAHDLGAQPGASQGIRESDDQGRRALLIAGHLGCHPEAAGGRRKRLPTARATSEPIAKKNRKVPAWTRAGSQSARRAGNPCGTKINAKTNPGNKRAPPQSLRARTRAT